MRRGPFTESRFILCEGFEDAALARGLIGTTSRHLPAFDVSPIPDLADAAGKEGFGDAFIGSDAVRGFENIVDVIVVADNDSDALKSFNAVRDLLIKAKNEGNLKHDWAIPHHAGVRAIGHPSVSIWMWPTPGDEGCLETVL